ncbi:hypothetical protein E4T52_15175 [Aureobasidium sp. EXF-3400]|nr:hypothetical protein E4T51_14183 [Aureobasidium sp. EXF-12344]KAI4769786.1 hypothetical protein E4T52_15175 [Aureobasidium sp. EXF-3400]
MYHHANTNINPSQSSDHASTSTKSSETRKRQIPLAFTNTGWGREYIANPNWEQENLGKNNAPVRRGSQGHIPASTTSHYTSATNSTNTSMSDSLSAPSTVSPVPPQTSQQYSVMVSWNFFRRTFPQSISPTSPDAENRISLLLPEQEEIVELGPWLEMLTKWDDFEQWQLKMLQRSCEAFV